MNKRGSLEATIYIVGGLGILIFVAFLFIVGSAVLNNVADEIVPVLDGLGVVGYTNMTQASEIAIHPVNTVIQSMTWFGTILMVFGIIAIFALAFVYRNTTQKWVIPLFFILMFVLVLVCIFFSNMYQELLIGTDDLTNTMNEYTGLNYFILYSPMIVAIVGFIAGIIMFSGANQEETA